MVNSKVMSVAVAALAVIALGGVIALSSTGSALGHGYANAPSGLAGDRPTASPAKPAAAGPLIGEAKAKEVAGSEVAASRAAAPVTRQETMLLPYKAIAAFSGATMHTVDPDRLFYYVVTSGGAFQSRGGMGADPMTCGSFVTIVDAVDGTVLALGCGGIGPWPDRLPPGFPR